MSLYHFNSVDVYIPTLMLWYLNVAEYFVCPKVTYAKDESES